MRAFLEVCEGAPLAKFSAGKVLLAEGTTSGHLYVLSAGEVEVLRGKTQVAIVDEPGALFGEMSVLLQQPHTATVRTTTPCSLYVFDDAASFLRSKPEIAFQVARLIASRLNAATCYLGDIKQQFQDRSDHLGMVGEVLDTLMHNQEEEFSPGPERATDPRL
ncbi:MAG: cyclic nucleotide-binding domain-containing protein [Methyloceanibacter sp.]|nr:cyclic nucleotide-binding domain-containing protein [Methyloceanibacter sp.]